MSGAELERRPERLAEIAEQLLAVARGLAAAGAELRAAVKEDDSQGDTAVEPASGRGLQAVGATSSLVAQIAELRLKLPRSGHDSGTLAHGSAKQEDCKSKSQKEVVPATDSAPQQGEEMSALETRSSIQQVVSQEMGMLALETVVKNQEVMKMLMAELVKRMGAVERRICNIEQEMGLITRFTQELNEMGEDNWT